MIDLIAMLALSVWVLTVEVRLARLYVYNDFLKDRVVYVDARMCILEGSGERDESEGPKK